MAEQLKREFDLFVLRARMDLEGGVGVACDFEGRLEGEFQTFDSWRLSAEEFGLPEVLASRRGGSETVSFDLPMSFCDRLKEEMDERAPASTPLWLHLANPSGYLPLLPWEERLAPGLERSVLRLPDFLDHAKPEPDGELTVALCASSSLALTHFPFDVSQALEVLAKAALGAAPERVWVHVFADTESALGAKDLLAAESQVTVHLPPEGSVFERGQAAQSQPSYGAESAEERSPWLRWVGSVLEERSVDLVHFLAQGFLSRSMAALAVTESPTSDLKWRSARFVQSSQLGTFASRLGAWGVLVSSPPLPVSRLAIRQLADELASARPGPVVHHDFAVDSEGDQLTHAYRVVLGLGEPKSLPGVSISCHPSLVAGRVPSVLAESSPAPKLQRAAKKAWMQVGARYLEKCDLELSKTTMGAMRGLERTKAADGVEDTLRKMQDILSSWSDRQDSE